MNQVSSRRNYKAIIAVSLLAIFLWIMVKMSKNYDLAYDIPLDIINNNPETCLKYPVPERVRVVFWGRGNDLVQLKFYDIRYEIDLSDVKKHIVLNLSEHPEFVHFPEDINVQARSILRPQELTFELDRRSQRKIPIRVQYQMKTAPGYTLVSTTPFPDSILVTGPATFVDTLKAVFTERKEFSEINLPFKENFQIIKNTIFFASYVPQKVEVIFDVQRLAEKELSNIPVQVINIPQKFEVVPLPSFVKVYIKGGEKILANAMPDDFQVIIDFRRDWHPGVRKLPASISTDLNILYAETQPSHFELIIQKKRNR